MASIGQRSKLQRQLYLAYIICVHIIVAVLIFKTDFIPKVKGKFFSSGTTVNQYSQTMLIYHQAMDASVPAKAAIFLGDSITQGLATAAIAQYSVNYGIAGETALELMRNISKYQSINRASIVFLMIGINDIYYGNIKSLPEWLRTIASAIPEDIPLVWSGIMPVYAGKIDPVQIASANHVIREICAARVSCVYIDTQKIFSIGGGGASLFRDGVHPNDQGYEKWIAALRNAYYEVTRQKS
jgi:lysophospholipase L1-like esterase